MAQNVNVKPDSSGKPELKSKDRIASIDVLRGLTIFAMIFVNDVAGVKNIPGWMKHMPADANGMTFVDVVFPAFLFIVGMAIPFSISKRISKGDSILGIIKHIIIRTAGLLVLGILMVNMGGFSQAVTGMNKQLWIILVFISAIIVWNAYPKKSGNEKLLFSALKFMGLAGLILLAVIYRRVDDGDIKWLQTSWWGILGLIGWAYLASSVVYLLFRKYPAAIAAGMFLFSLLYVAEKSGAFSTIFFFKDTLLPGIQVGSHASITTAGILLSVILTSQRFDSLRKKIAAMFVYSIFLLVTGLLYYPQYGINKIYATPSWCYLSSFICVILFILLYYFIDIKKYHKWSSFLKPAGVNPLLAYLLPSIFYSLITITGFTFYSEIADGFTGIIRSLVFTFLMLGITHYLTRLNIKLHL